MPQPKYLKPNLVEGMLYTLYFQRVAPQKAYERVKRMTGEETLSLEQVKDLFLQMDAGKFPLREMEEKVDTLVKVMKATTKKDLDLKTSIQLRRTFFSLQYIVNLDSFHLYNLRYEFGANKIEITFDYLKVTFIYVADKVTGIMFDGKYRLIEDDMFTLSEGFLHNVIRHDETTIETLHITEHMSELEHILRYQEVKPDFVAKKISLEKVLYELDPRELEHKRPKLKVKNIKYYSLQGFEDLYETIRWLDPDFLNSIQMTGSTTPIQMNEPNFAVFYTEQWQKLKRIELMQPCPIEILCTMCHMGLASVRAVSFPTVEEFKKILERILLNQSLNQFRIKCPVNEENYNAVIRYIETIEYQRNNHIAWHYLQYPNGSPRWLSMRIAKKRIWLRGPCFQMDDWEEGDGHQLEEDIADEPVGTVVDMADEIGW
ncbi:hypothetical protein GCK72_011423 [Caenorhabditis remanei]|uniref:DUF38 domain-containing protein n=1 Tax=Caenorhabditis remanei TaxID=31234 RepID=A0A6A5H7J1_CAERE|nr:hypothetical protein GCK72_011423 [Caenorhabditis remanei]KAF1763157.1 hypothetical protein GCK72_011423 [Caenorhabditis remanei]